MSTNVTKFFFKSLKIEKHRLMKYFAENYQNWSQVWQKWVKFAKNGLKLLKLSQNLTKMAKTWTNIKKKLCKNQEKVKNF